MSNMPQFPWPGFEEKYPDIAKMIRGMYAAERQAVPGQGATPPVSATARTEPAPTTEETVAPARAAGRAIRKTVSKAVKDNPVLQFNKGFLERLYESGVGTARFVVETANPWTQRNVVLDAIEAGKKAVEKSGGMSAAVRGHFEGAAQAARVNPGYETGKAAADLLMVFSPGALTRLGTAAAKAPVKAVSRVRAAPAVAPAAAARVQVAPAAPSAARPAPSAPLAAETPLERLQRQISEVELPKAEKPAGTTEAIGAEPAVPTVEQRLAGEKVGFDVDPVTGETVKVGQVPGKKTAVRRTAGLTPKQPVSASVAPAPAATAPAAAPAAVGAIAETGEKVARVRVPQTPAAPAAVARPAARPVVPKPKPPAAVAPAPVAPQPALRAPEPAAVEPVRPVEAPAAAPVVPASAQPAAAPAGIKVPLPKDLRRFSDADLAVMRDTGLVPMEAVDAELARRAAAAAQKAAGRVPAAPGPVAAVSQRPAAAVAAEAAPELTEAQMALAAEQAARKASAEESKRRLMETARRRKAEREGRLAEQVAVAEAKPATIAVEEGKVSRLPGEGVELTPVKSTAVEAYGYNPATQELVIKFPGQPKPRMWQVPQDVADAFAAAESKGKAFNQLIKGRPELGLPAGDLAIKNLADSVRDMVANMPADVRNPIGTVVKGIGRRAEAAGVKAKDLVDQVMRTIPEDPEQFAAWAKEWRAARRAAIERVSAVEVPAAEVSKVREAVEEVTRMADDVPSGMQIDAPEIAGAATIASSQRVRRWWDSLVTSSDKIRPEVGRALVRARTLGEETYSGFAERLADVRWKRITPAERQEAYDIVFQGASPSSVRGMAVEQVVGEVVATGRVSPAIDVMRTPGAIDWWKVSDQWGWKELADSLVTANALSPVAARTHAVAMQSMLQARKPVRQVVNYMLKNGLKPGYDMMSDMKKVVPAYLQRVSNEIGFGRVIPDEKRFLQMMQNTNHPDLPLWRRSYERWRGREQVSVHDIAEREIHRFANSMAVVVWLSPITAIKQFSQLVPSMLDVPMVDATRGFAKALLPRNGREAARAGATMRDFQQLIGYTYESLERAGAMGVAADWATIGAGVVSKVTGIQAMDNFVRAGAYLAKKSHLEGLVDDAMRGNSRATSQLIREGANVSDPMMRAAATDPLAARTVADEVRRAAVEYSHRKNLRTDLLESPMKLTEPGWGQAMRGLNMFAWQMTRMVWNDLVKPTFNLQNLRAANWYNLMKNLYRVGKFTAGSAVLGDFLAQVEAWALGRERPTDFGARLATAAGTIGSLGLADTLVSSLVDAEGNLVESDRMPLVMAQNFKRMTENVLIGAGWRTVGDVPVAVAQMAAGKPRRAARMVPVIGPWLSEYYREQQ